MSSHLRILFVGDIVGSAGRHVLKRELPKLRKEKQIDFVIANAENAAHGFGLTLSTAEEILGAGVDLMSGGNHIWDKREVAEVFKKYPDRLVRPANYPDHLPGRGFVIRRVQNQRLGFINVMGRIFMDPLDCPFRSFDSIHEKIKNDIDCLIVDIHAETTSEKSALGWYVDGRASALVGSHTHVQTADERILPKGTGFLSDAGMTGPFDSVIGMKTEIILQRFLEKMPVRMEVAEGRGVFSGVLFDIDPSTGRCIKVERVRKIDEQ